MNKLMATMFVLGIPWLLLVVPVILSPVGIFIDEYHYKAHDVVTSILLSVCGLLGIAIWLGYRLRWKMDDFIWVSKRQFWSLSVFHHALWILLLPRLYPSPADEAMWSTLKEFWLSGGTCVYGVWISVSLLIALFALVFDRDHPENPRSRTSRRWTTPDPL